MQDLFTCLQMLRVDSVSHSQVSSRSPTSSWPHPFQFSPPPPKPTTTTTTTTANSRGLARSLTSTPRGDGARDREVTTSLAPPCGAGSGRGGLGRREITNRRRRCIDPGNVEEQGQTGLTRTGVGSGVGWVAEGWRWGMWGGWSYVWEKRKTYPGLCGRGCWSGEREGASACSLWHRLVIFLWCRDSYLPTEIGESELISWPVMPFMDHSPLLAVLGVLDLVTIGMSGERGSGERRGHLCAAVSRWQGQTLYKMSAPVN